jgi:hypothetical protein
MPSASRLSGDQYQHLYSWLRMLDLMGPNPRAKTVWVERDDALHADDVVIEPTDKTRPLEFIQVKFHVNMRTSYSSSELIRIDANAATSILGKLFKSWQKLHSETDQLFELKLLSNWVWATDDPLGKYVSGRDNRAFRRFITDTDSSIAQIREAWLDHLSCSVDELAAFLEHTRFRLGYDDYTDLWQRTAHTMGLLGLNDTDKDILACISKVGHMIVEGPKEIDGEILQSIVNELTLVQPFEEDAFVPVYVQTIEPELLSQPSPYEIDWCGDFAGRSVYDNGVWNSKFLPELRSIKQHIISTTETRLLKVRGQARLSIWVALG